MRSVVVPKRRFSPTALPFCLVAGLILYSGNATAAARLLDLESCEVAETGWLNAGIVRKLHTIRKFNPETNRMGDITRLIYDFSPSTPDAGIQRYTAQRIEEVIKHSASFFKATAQMRGPPNLLCVIDPSSGELKYVQFIDPAMEDGTMGEYNWKRRAKAGTPDIRLAPEVIRAFDDLAQRIPAASKHIMTPAHELIHAIQGSYSMFTVCGKPYGVCGDGWVDEGIADAFAYAWLRMYERARPVRKIKLKRPLRYLDEPLHQPSKWGREANDQNYATSYFWEYLAWEPKYVYTDKDKELETGLLAGLRPKSRFDSTLIKRFMNLDEESKTKYRPDSARANQWQLEWLDKILKDALVKAKDKLKFKIPRNPKGGLFVIYPKFAAWMLAHQTNGVKDKKLDRALQRLFKNGYKDENGDKVKECPKRKVKFSEGPAETITIPISEVATACLRLQRVGENKNSDVDIIMKEPSDAFGQIHLGWDGEVVPPHEDKYPTRSKKWTIGQPFGTGKYHAAGGELIIAISNIPEDMSEIVALKIGKPTRVLKVKLEYRYSTAGDSND